MSRLTSDNFLTKCYYEGNDIQTLGASVLNGHVSESSKRMTLQNRMSLRMGDPNQAFCKLGETPSNIWPLSKVKLRK